MRVMVIVVALVFAGCANDPEVSDIRDATPDATGPTKGEAARMICDAFCEANARCSAPEPGCADDCVAELCGWVYCDEPVADHDQVLLCANEMAERDCGSGVPGSCKDAL